LSACPLLFGASKVVVQTTGPAAAGLETKAPTKDQAPTRDNAPTAEGHAPTAEEHAPTAKPKVNLKLVP
jgi:hypothetical protein